MKRIIFGFSVIVLATIFALSCSKDEDTDTEKPAIDMEVAGAFPRPCDTIYIGEAFVFKAQFSDNVELGSFNLELHHNFDHHTHGSHVETCPIDVEKEPVNPFYYNESFDIPTGRTEFDAQIQVDIPGGVDPGDYHFMVKLTDQEGWQSWKSVSVKLVDL